MMHRLYKKRQGCPECRGQLTEKKNLFMEKILGELPKTECKYDGCSFAKVDVNRVKRHQDDCSHRLVNCNKVTEITLTTSCYTLSLTIGFLN